MLFWLSFSNFVCFEISNYITSFSAPPQQIGRFLSCILACQHQLNTTKKKIKLPCASVRRDCWHRGLLDIRVLDSGRGGRMSSSFGGTSFSSGPAMVCAMIFRCWWKKSGDITIFGVGWSFIYPIIYKVYVSQVLVGESLLYHPSGLCLCSCRSCCSYCGPLEGSCHSSWQLHQRRPQTV